VTRQEQEENEVVPVGKVPKKKMLSWRFFFFEFQTSNALKKKKHGEIVFCGEEKKEPFFHHFCFLHFFSNLSVLAAGQ
jgi:hypothetical protein